MESLSAEAASLASKMKLRQMIVLYDDNNILNRHRTDIAFGEDVCARFEAYGWHTMRIDGQHLSMPSVQRFNPVRTTQTNQRDRL